MSPSFSYLSENDRERLRQLPFPVALPQWLPSGWSMRTLEIYVDPEDEQTSLELPFEGPHPARWSILTSDGGFGDVLPGEIEHTHQMEEHELFGPISVHRFLEEGEPEVVSDWFPEDEEAGVYHAFRGAHLAEETLRALLESLELFGDS